MNYFFMLTCNSTYNPPALYFGEIPVQSISVDEGTMSVHHRRGFRLLRRGRLTMNINRWMQLGDGPFRFSDTRNKLTALGCDTLAFMTDAEGTFGSGCVSLCEENITLEDSCSGIGCCQTAVPRSLKTLNITIAMWTIIALFWPLIHVTSTNARNQKSIHAKAVARIQLGITHVVLGALMLVSIIIFLIVIIWKKRRKEKNFLDNGGEKTNIIQKFLSSLENKKLSEILCFNATDEEMEEIGVFAELAKQCLSSNGVNRPTMKVCRGAWEVDEVASEFMGSAK
ncbi:hypothetical protein GH714_012664 [Hevea brasiliensis]|uniref:Wall-associated receptor kinase galacturonan-binding domain-containing protein n=1 Tax=Hevea brasiliensis TaxID=3981 RepID=A0A6A6N856_HEVBR|nr:hypothetical protein GH714_012664 [Hevea brasiliensis]